MRVTTVWKPPLIMNGLQCSLFLFLFLFIVFILFSSLREVARRFHQRQGGTTSPLLLNQFRVSYVLPHFFFFFFKGLILYCYYFFFFFSFFCIYPTSSLLRHQLLCPAKNRITSFGKDSSDPNSAENQVPTPSLPLLSSPPPSLSLSLSLSCSSLLQGTLSLSLSVSFFFFPFYHRFPCL